MLTYSLGVGGGALAYLQDQQEAYTGYTKQGARRERKRGKEGREKRKHIPDSFNNSYHSKCVLGMDVVILIVLQNEPVLVAKGGHLVVFLELAGCYYHPGDANLD